MKEYAWANVEIQTDAKYTEEQYLQYGNSKYTEGYTVGVNDTTGEGKYWNKTTTTFPESGNTLTISLGYIPSFVFISANNNSNGWLYNFYSYDNCKTFYQCRYIPESIEATESSRWTFSQNDLIFTPSVPNSWQGNSFEIYAIK